MTKSTNNTTNDLFSKTTGLHVKDTRPVYISLIIAALIIGLISGFLIKGCGMETHMMSHGVAQQESGGKILFWTCSMHPQIKQEASGSCPICGMDLIPMKEDIGGGDKASLTLGKRARQLASVKTTLVVYKNLTKSIHTVGKIDYDESKISHVSSWVNGRIDKLYVNFTGTIVQKGEHLVYIYSPELVSTQDEYLIAYRGAKTLKKSSIIETVMGSASLLENTRDRLLLLGITEKQIKKLEDTQMSQTHLTIYAPDGGTVIDKNIFEGMYVKTGDRLFTIVDLSRVWLYLDIYEYDIQWIKYGQDVEVATESFPGKVFHGTVVFIDPFLDDDTRTVRVRVNMDNREGKLKPGMFASAVIKSRFGAGGIIFDPDIAGKYMCPMHPDIISDEPGDCPECGMDLELIGVKTDMDSRLTIDDTKSNIPPIRNLQSDIENRKGVLAVPHSAVLYTGLRNLVYVEKKEGNYVAREVKLGIKADEYYYVISGLKQGERVVTSGNFLIDSQMQLLGKPSLLFPDGSGFQGSADTKDEKTEHLMTEIFDVPLFRDVMNKIMDNYFSIRADLANDSINGIENNILLMEANIKKIKKNDFGFPEDVYRELTVILSHIGHNLADMKGKTLDETRDAFKAVSKDLTGYVKRFHGRIKDAEKVYTFFCPMVNAPWLQETKEIGNPYYGAKMINCGTLEDL
ncbi:MAG: efflux RND transporter periplasmic adaptor subunit [Candidatus Anammoxibacter sp.]